jgi:hypothetical protein
MTSQRIRGSAAAGVLASVLALAGCGSDSKPEPAAAAKATPDRAATPAKHAVSVAALPGRLAGSWKRAMRPRDWGPAGKGYPLGTWRFDLDGHGELGVYLPRTDTVDFTTKFTVKGHRLTIDTIPICPTDTGRYTWRASAHELTLTVVDDDKCTARAALFGGAWTRR